MYLEQGKMFKKNKEVVRMTNKAKNLRVRVIDYNNNSKLNRTNLSGLCRSF